MTLYQRYAAGVNAIDIGGYPYRVRIASPIQKQDSLSWNNNVAKWRGPASLADGGTITCKKVRNMGQAKRKQRLRKTLRAGFGADFRCRFVL